MSRIQFSFPSRSLQFRTDVEVFVPDRLPDGYTLEQLPVIYLLHGLSGNREDWILNTSLARYVDQYKAIVVCPDGQRGFYLDLENGPSWFTYITEELPELLGAHLRIGQARDQRMIGGDSMGGYGAARIFALRPDHYSAMAAFSAPLSIDLFAVMKDGDEAFFAEMKKMLGYDPLSLYGSDKDPLIWLDRIQEWQDTNTEQTADLSFYCGTEDDFIAWSRLYAHEAKQRGICFRYSESAGGHEFNYWDACLNEWMNRVTTVYYDRAELAATIG